MTQAADAREAGGRSKLAGRVVRLAVSAALLALVFEGLALSEVAAALRGADLLLIGAAIVVNWAGPLFSVTRWRGLLRAQGGDAGFWAMVSSFLVAQCFNNLLPSTIGGDAVRAWDTHRFGTSRGAALAIVVVDRLLGLAALAVFAIIAASVVARPTISPLALGAAVGAAAAVLGFAAWVMVAPPALVVALLERLPDALRRQIRAFSRQIGMALMRFHRTPGVIARGFGVSIVLQATVVVFYALIGAGLGFQVPFTHYFFIVPIAVIAMLVPVSINAIGVREGIFAFLLAAEGVPRAGAVAFAWIAYGSVAAQAVVGGFLYLARAREGDRPRRLEESSRVSGAAPVVP